MTNTSETTEPSTENSSSIEDTGRRPDWRRSWLWAALAGLAAVAVAAMYLLAGTNPQHAPSAASKPSARAAGISSSQRPAVPAKSVAPPAPTVEQVANSGHLSAKLATRLRRWNAGVGGTALALVANDLGTALQAGGVKLYSPMRSACASLAAAVGTAQSDPPIPDRATQASYVAALAGLATAAADCRAAISQQVSGDETLQTEEHPVLLQRAEAELGAGTRNLYVVTQEIAAARRK
jgi:hypothetical protein